MQNNSIFSREALCHCKNLKVPNQLTSSLAKGAHVILRALALSTKIPWITSISLILTENDLPCNTRLKLLES